MIFMPDNQGKNKGLLTFNWQIPFDLVKRFYGNT
jgi:hypothetical protein